MEEEGRGPAKWVTILITGVLFIGLAWLGIYITEEKGIEAPTFALSEVEAQEARDLGVSIWIVAGIIFITMICLYGFFDIVKRHV